MLWIGIILFVSRPLLASTELPVAFRAASYLDIFGWHSQHFRAEAVENQRGVLLSQWDKANPGPDDQRRAFNTFMEVGKRCQGRFRASKPCRGPFKWRFYACFRHVDSYFRQFRGHFGAFCLRIVGEALGAAVGEVADLRSAEALVGGGPGERGAHEACAG